MVVRAPSRPFSGWRSSSASIFGIAAITGNHLCTFHNLLNRIPMRNTTTSPSTSAVNLPGWTLPITTSTLWIVSLSVNG
jgi:hypothetical protein